MNFSIVVPVYNEEESISTLFDEIQSAMAAMLADYEVVFVDDGSTDASADIIKDLSVKYPDTVKLISTGREGQTHAMKTGIERSSGNSVITLDADLQNDPGDIPKLAKKMNEGGFDCVCGWRRSRKDTFLKTAMSKTANIIQRLFTGCPVHDISCTLRIYTRECAGRIPLNWPGQHRFIALCLAMQGFKIGEVESNHRQRQFGESKYSHKRVFRVVFDFFKILSTGGKK